MSRTRKTAAFVFAGCSIVLAGTAITLLAMSLFDAPNVPWAVWPLIAMGALTGLIAVLLVEQENASHLPTTPDQSE